ncbi:MAG: polysaccharide deacetylase family protein [Sulfitobacter sp.]|jgi:hypothetical protein|nr:polysaccharide deacetylase family protein [Sulfitobacter sp.]
MATWAELDTELALWQAQGEQPSFWWRDDDTEAPTQALARLIELSAKYDAPLHLAVIPADIHRDLADMLRAAPHVWCLQHGFAHKNNEPKGERASEVGKSRDLDLQQADLAEGWKRMQHAELPNLLPVMVPPWSRIGAQVVPHLPRWGYAALSVFDRRAQAEDAAGLLHFNAHVEPLRWRPDARFAGVEKTLEQCVTHLRERRTGVADRDEPTGLLTHHLQTPQQVWEFCDELAARLSHGDQARWVPLNAMLKRQ